MRETWPTERPSASEECLDACNSQDKADLLARSKVLLAGQFCGDFPPREAGQTIYQFLPL
jgi:hypothetical protein